MCTLYCICNFSAVPTYIAFTTFQVSAVTDQMGLQDAGKTTGDLDDDEGGGLVSSALDYGLIS